MPKEICASMSNKDLIAKLTDMSHYNAKAVFILRALTDDDWYRAVSELRRRYVNRSQASFVQESITAKGRPTGASTVELDSVRWKSWFANRRMRLNEVGSLLGYSPDWASIVACKKKASYWTLDRLACALGVNTDDFVWAVSSDRERERMDMAG